MDWNEAQDIKKELNTIVKKLKLTNIDLKKVICFRSFGSTSRAKARIWSFPRIWQKALKKSPHYIIEVLSENFDKLSSEDKIKVLIHELLHIPKNFSGSLIPHKTRHRRIDARRVEILFKKLNKS